MRWLGIGIAAVGTAFGVFSERLAFGWDDPRHVIPDLVVGLVFLATGAGVWSQARGIATLLLATAYTWFLANLVPDAVYWHRGLILHLLLCYPGWRPRTKAAAAVVGMGYIAAVVTPIWRNDVASLGVCAALVTVAWYQRASSVGNARHQATVAAVAATVLAAVLVGGDLARLAWPTGDAVLPSLWVYQCTLSGIAIALYAGVRWHPTPVVTDLVVELGERRPTDVRGELARALGDTSLQIGYWQPDAGGYVDADGRPVREPGASDGQAGTYVHSGGHPFAVLIHDRAVLADPDLLSAVATATRLAAFNAELNAQLRGHVAAVGASRRRLLLAADDERRRLEKGLHDGAGQRLHRLHDDLISASRDAATAPHLWTAKEQLELTVDALIALARGLHPPELASGLRGALAALTERNAVPVHLSVPDERFPAEVEAAIYYTCAEALANVSKHAAATSASIEVVHQDGELVVVASDNGRGGADLAQGTGLQGLSDRIETLGGVLAIEFSTAAGTRLIATLPVG